MDLPEAYQVLELPPGASKEDVRRSYKDLLKVWHPDRHASDPPLQRRAEERLKRINAAFELIERAGFPTSPTIRPSHTEQAPPPPPGPAPPNSSATDRAPHSEPPSAAGHAHDSSQSPTPTPTSSSPFTSSPNYALRAFVTLVGIVGGFAVWSYYEERQKENASLYSSYETPSRHSEPEPRANTPNDPPPPIRPPQSAGTDVSIAARRSPPSFTLGSTKAEVETAQGSPSRIDKTYGETWSYETASVEFRDGKVFAWRSSPFVKLNVKLEPKDKDKASVARTRGNFTLDSTKDDVLAVQGTPDGLDRTYGETWTYGTSTIQFADGKVHSWHNSPVGTALKVHLAARSTAAADAAAQRGSYGPNATIDEVLAVEGTPTSIDKSYGETWSYGTSTISFNNGHITEYHNSPVGPILKIRSASSDSGRATIEGFMNRVIKAMDEVADDACACGTLACAQQVASSTRDRGFKAGYAYTRGKEATPELITFISTMIAENGNGFTDYVKQNHAAWFGRFKVRLESCIEDLKGNTSVATRSSASARGDVPRPMLATFKLGDSSQRVLAVQGKPDEVMNNSATRETWIYGSAAVILEEGKVVDYRNSGGRLRIE